MAATERFLFETSFDPEFSGRRGDQGKDSASAEEALSEEPPEPLFSSEDLAAAGTESFAAGREQALQEASQSQEAETSRALAAVAESLDKLFQGRSEAEKDSREQALGAAVVILRKLFPSLAQSQAMPEIEKVIAECLERLREEPRIVIRIADPLLDRLRDHIEDLTSRTGYEGKIVLLSEADLSPGSVRVEWADGGADRDVDRIWAKVDEILSLALGTGPSVLDQPTAIIEQPADSGVTTPAQTAPEQIASAAEPRSGASIQ